MKKVLFTLTALLLSVIAASAQLMRAEELEKYAKENYGDKWNEAAQNLKSQIALDKNNALTYEQVIQVPDKTASQLYVILNYWYTTTFNDANAVIKLNDKELGCIIGQGYVEGIAAHTGGTNSYVVNIRPVIKTDIKDGRVRVTYTVPAYNVVKLNGGGILGAFGGTVPTRDEQTWPIEKCFPFVEKDSHKKTSSKALVMAHAYSNVILDKIEEALKNGITGNEDDDW